MSVVQINVKVEKDLKKDVDAVLNAIGISTTDAVRVFFKRVVMDKGFPFELTTKKDFSDETKMAVERSYDKKNLIKFNNLDELKGYLEEDD